MRKKGKSERAKLIRKCDDLSRKLMRLSRGGSCQRCGGLPDPRGLHVHHIITRSNHALRWHLPNLLLLCYGCHRWFHGHPQASRDWHAERYPVAAALLEEAATWGPEAIRITDLRALADCLTRTVKQMESNKAGGHSTYPPASKGE